MIANRGISRRRALVAATVVVWLTAGNAEGQVATNISPDGTLDTTVSTLGNVVAIGGGTVRGGNQFHSFSRFDVGTGDIASFGGPSSVQNILSRVSGGVGSSIDGMIRSEISGANFFLMNPSGIVFGPNATLDVTGSAHFTTADFVGLDDDVQFAALPSAKDALLSTAAPASFGFLQPNPAPIEVNAGVLNLETFTFDSVLAVPIQQSLSFVGGELAIEPATGDAPGGFVFAPAGRMNMVSVGSPGEVSFASNAWAVQSPSGGESSGITLSGFTQLGAVQVGPTALVDAAEVVVRGGRLVIDDGTIFPGVSFIAELPVPPPDGGFVDIEVSDDLSINGTGGFLALPGISIFNGAGDALIPGDAPDVSVRAPNVLISGGAGIQYERNGPGEAAEVSLEVGRLEIRDGATIGLSNFFAGAGGMLTVDASEVLIGNPDDLGPTGLFAVSDFHPAFGQVSFAPSLQFADSAAIVVNAQNRLQMEGSAGISADSFALGRSGDVTVTAGEMLLSGTGPETGVIAAQSGISGDSGSVNLIVEGEIRIENGFRVSASSFGSGDGGPVNITIGGNASSGSLDLTGSDSRILSGTAQATDPEYDDFARRYDAVFQFLADTPIPDYATLRAALGITPANGDLMEVMATLSGIPGPDGNTLLAATDFEPGSAGEIQLFSPEVELAADTRILTSTGWDGAAGAIAVNATTLQLTDGGSVSSQSGIVRLDGTRVVGAGDAGSVSLTATGPEGITVSGRSPETGVPSSVSTSTFGDGDGGLIQIDAPTIAISDGGEVTADSTGAGLTGDVALSASDQIVLDNGQISTSATTSDGGNIDLLAPNIIQLTESEVSTSVQSGVGGGGNILVDPEFVVLNDSQIIANAFGGPGGNIRIVAGNFVPSADSLVEASSQLGVQGTIVIESPENDIASQIAQLPKAYLDVSALLPERCAARRSGSESSFVVTGRGGLPPNPDGYLPSFVPSSGAAETRGEAVGPALDPDTASVRTQAITLALWSADCDRTAEN